MGPPRRGVPGRPLAPSPARAGGRRQVWGSALGRGPRASPRDLHRVYEVPRAGGRMTRSAPGQQAVERSMRPQSLTMLLTLAALTGLVRDTACSEAPPAGAAVADDADTSRPRDKEAIQVGIR